MPENPFKPSPEPPVETGPESLDFDIGALAKEVFENIDALKEIPPELHREIANKLIEAGVGDYVADNLDKFSGLDHNDIAHKLIEAGFMKQVVKKLDHFLDLDAYVAVKLIELDINNRNKFRIPRFIESWRADQRKEVAKELIKNNFGDEVAERLDKIPGLDTEFAFLLCADYEARAVIDKLELFDLSGATDKERLFFDFLVDESIPLKVRESHEVAQYIGMHMRAVQQPEDGRTEHEHTAFEIGPDALKARITLGIPPMVYAWHDMRVGPPEDAPPEELLRSWEYQRFDGATESDEDIHDKFVLLGEYFGTKNALNYLTLDVTEHDAVYFLPDMIRLQERSGLTQDEFGKIILTQVGRDGASYDDDDAHARFAAICQELSKTDPSEILSKAEQYPNIKQLQDLLVDIREQGAASSWKTLKKTYELVQLLNRTEILEELNSGNLDPKLRTYIERLAFHPNISTEAVIRFWKDPASFLDIEDQHTDARVNEVKKPSNYLSLPYLGLKAEDLRDAYVFGELDALQTLAPMERTYTLGGSEANDLSRPEVVYGFLFRALGQERKGVKGEGKNSKKIFHELRAFCVENGCQPFDLVDPEKGPALIRAWPEDTVERLRSIIFDPKIGMSATKPSGETYRIRIGDKSDPEMAVAGNDTASCMPFGSGKNNVYMFNPNCTQLVLERRTSDGVWRTAAQSVMTIDYATSTPTPELIRSYEKSDGHLTDLLSEEDFGRLPVVTCDNIEVAKNEEGERTRYVREAYERFFKDYLSSYANELSVDATRVVIGSSYTPKNLGFKTIPNTFVPQAPMGYSDNVNASSFVIETGLKSTEELPRQNMSPLTTRDSLAVATIEGKAYKDNESLLMNLHHMQNAIIGMEIANTHFKRPNLSFVYRDAKQIPRGYMLAYEGVKGDLPEVYIDDLASDGKNRMAGGRLIRQFFGAYLANYGMEERPFIPIFTNARESTRYPILQANVQRLAERSGLVAEMVEVGTHERGGDVMRDVRIHVAHTREELEKQKQKYRGL